MGSNKSLIITFACIFPIMILLCGFMMWLFNIAWWDWMLAGLSSGYFLHVALRDEHDKSKTALVLLDLVFVIGGWATFCYLGIGLINGKIKRTPIALAFIIIMAFLLYYFHNDRIK